jgi:tRNA-dihydrouridine synthase
MIARGSLGNRWIFEQLTGRRSGPPARDEVRAELLWVIDRAEEHMGSERAARYLRKFYPWYLERLGAGPEATDVFQRSEDLDIVRGLVAQLDGEPVAA